MNRLNWLDIIRGIAMIAVVMGHMLFEGDLYVYFFSFQVALFFLISGISYGISSRHEKMSIKDFVIDKYKKLVIPYFWLNVFCFPIWFINNIVLLGKSGKDILTVIGGIIYSNQSVMPMSSYSTWFLTCLFLVSVLFKVLDNSFKNNKIWLFISIFVCGFIGVLLPSFEIKTSLPWHLQTVLTAVVFYYIGYVYIKNERKIEQFFNKLFSQNIVQYFFIFLFLIVGFLIAIENGKISLRNSNYHNMLYFYVSALVSSFSYIALSKKIGKCKILEFIGTNTLVILATHRIIMRFFLYVSPVTNAFILDYPIITGIVIILINIPIIVLINKYLPFIVGKKKKISFQN